MQNSGRMAGQKPHFSMPAEMKLGAPTLRVRDVTEALTFYRQDFGLGLTRSYEDPADGLQVHELAPAASSEPLLILKEDRAAATPSPDFAGLYHFAVLVPTRKSLASTYLALGMSGVNYDGFADHYVSEALYLHDSAENGIEVYADRPKETWSSFKVSSSEDRSAAMERFSSLNKPLDFGSLLRELDSRERTTPVKFAEGARIGHMHLRVTNLPRSVEFYHEAMGLDIMVNSPEIGAAFLSVGGYHHHLGLNVWHSHGGAQHQKGEAGLDKFTMTVTDAKVLDELDENLRTHSAKFVRDADHLVTTDPNGIIVEVHGRKTTVSRAA